MHIWKTVLAGMFLGAAALGAIMPMLGLAAPVFPASSLLNAVTAGDFIEALGTAAVGLAAALWAIRHQQTVVAARELEARAAQEHAHARQLEARAADIRAHETADAC